MYEGCVADVAQREKIVQIDVGDLNLRDSESRLWAHNLSARVGLEVRGAMMNTPQQKGQVRFITRPKSRTMRTKRKKRSRANRTKVPK